MKDNQTMPFTEEYLLKNLMGPNCVTMLTELTENLPLHGLRILDLGCGTGLTSMVLATRFGAQVFATDLWIGANENYERFCAAGLGDRIIPIHADANELPFAHAYFDAVVSVDAYLYFGIQESYLEEKLAPLVKPGGIIALAFVGFRQEMGDDIPPEFLLSWKKEDLADFHSCDWWREHLRKAPSVEVLSIGEMNCNEQSWADWLRTDHPYAMRDRPAMEAGAGKYMNLISVIAKKKPI